MGKPALDFMHVICNGHACAIETKAPGKTYTPRQLLTKKEIEAAGGIVFLTDGDFKEIEQWLTKCTEQGRKIHSPCNTGDLL